VTDLIRLSVLSLAAVGAPLAAVVVLAAVARRRKPEALADKDFRRRTGVLAGATVVAWAGLVVWLRTGIGPIAASAATLTAVGPLLVLSFLAMAALLRMTAGPSVTRQARRTASLWARSLRRYLSLPALMSPYLIVVAAGIAVAWRTIDGPLMVNQKFAIAYLGATLVLLLLYTVRLAQIAHAPQELAPAAGPEADIAVDLVRRRSLSTLNRWQLVLAAGLGALSVAAALLDWTRPPQAVAGSVVSAAATLLAVACCARAIGADLGRQAPGT